MPRRSAAEISLVTLTPGRGRPEPPKELDLIERRAWNDVVDSLPGHWLDPAGQILLEQVAVQTAVSRRLALRLRQMREAPDAGDEALEVEAKLAAQHQAALRSMVIGLTTLRATPRSRVAPRDARPKFERNPGAQRPWEITARKVEDAS